MSGSRFLAPTTPGGLLANAGTGLTAAEQLLLQALVLGDLELLQSSTPTTKPGYGQVYVKSDGNLYFLNGSGTEYELTPPASGGSGALLEETPVGTVNGVNKSFTVANAPLFIVVEGQSMINGDGYTLSGLNITFDNAPPVGGTPHSFYNAGTGAGIAAVFGKDQSTSTASQTVITLSQVALFIISVTVNDQPLTLTTDYTYDSNVTITLNNPIPAGVPIVIVYIHS